MRYRGAERVLVKPVCDCPCSQTELGENPRCLKCNHIVKIRFVDDPYEENTTWIDPKTEKPVRTDEAWTREGKLE